MIKKGFTYIEIMVAIGIFILMMLFIMKLDSTASRNIRVFNEKVKMTYLAQSEIEKLKSNPNMVSTTKTIEDYTVKVEVSEFNKITNMNNIVRNVRVTVSKPTTDTNFENVVLECHLLKN